MSILSELSAYRTAILDLLYPRLCAGCGEALVGNETAICTSCRVKIPRTNAHNIEIPELALKFSGKVPITGVLAYLNYQKGANVQEMLHALKYNNKPEVGIELGKLYGYELKNDGWNPTCDLIISIPLHTKKLKRRGYNQSAKIAEGLSEGLGVAWSDDILKRTQFTDTQTKKGRFERFKNVSGIFELSNAELVRNKKIILVDDVITTGATFESAIEVLWRAQVAEVWVLALAMAVRH
jgi:ComF family protein